MRSRVIVPFQAGLLRRSTPNSRASAAPGRVEAHRARLVEARRVLGGEVDAGARAAPFTRRCSTGYVAASNSVSGPTICGSSPVVSTTSAFASSLAVAAPPRPSPRRCHRPSESREHVEALGGPQIAAVPGLAARVGRGRVPLGLLVHPLDLLHPLAHVGVVGRADRVLRRLHLQAHALGLADREGVELEGEALARRGARGLVGTGVGVVDRELAGRVGLDGEATRHDPRVGHRHTERDVRRGLVAGVLDHEVDGVGVALEQIGDGLGRAVVEAISASTSVDSS